MRIRLSIGVAAMLLAVAWPAVAQFPGEILGQVLAEESGAPVAAVLIELPALGLSASSDASGVFRFRGIEPGYYLLQARRVGYESRSEDIEVTNGRVTRVHLLLATLAVELQGIEVVAGRPEPSDGTRLGRARIERLGARTAGDAVREVPGVLLREEGVGGAQTISIRGSGTDAVLVLVDGVPINDPVTGVADLSTIPAAIIESVTVRVGAHSARYGPRAEAGVVEIETRMAESGVEMRAAGGTLGEWAVGGEIGGRGRGIGWSGGGHVRGMDGGFDYARVPGVDERIERRVNADLAEYGAFAAVHAPLGGGELRGRTGVEGVERGIPGKGYAPSTEARLDLDRLRSSLSWRRIRPDLSTVVSVAGVSQRVRYTDPAPPFGFAYDDATRVTSTEARAEITRPGGSSGLRVHGAGLEVRRQTVNADALTDDAPRSRTDGGLFAHGAVGAMRGDWDIELLAEARLDRDGGGGDWHPNRAITLRLTGGPVTLHASNRSGYSPPSLGDQFFREGVAIEPNPDLEAERVPSEWEIGASLSRRTGAFDMSGGARFYQGDIRGMIVWLPDFRFVWSPRNSDVKRHGMEIWGEVLGLYPGLRLTGSYSLAAVTYDRPGDDDDDVQVAYRPRHTAQLRAGWEHGAWRAGIGTLLTGTRYPAPAPLNPLDPFWTVNLDLGREWRGRAATLTTSIHVDRLLNEKDTLIFGFPEAGRRFRFEARLRRADLPVLDGGTP